MWIVTWERDEGPIPNFQYIMWATNPPTCQAIQGPRIGTRTHWNLDLDLCGARSNLHTYQEPNLLLGKFCEETLQIVTYEFGQKKTVNSAQASRPVLMLFKCSSCCQETSRDFARWKNDVEQYLRQSNLPKDFVAALLTHEDSDQELEDECEAFAVPIKGLPRRPLCNDLAWRLWAWKCLDASNNLLVAAETLGMYECEQAELPLPPSSRHHLRRWIEDAGENGILRLLGLRNTTGTDARRLLPPARMQLLSAAAQKHSPKFQLSVSARARAKHAHRGTENFFGAAKGNPEQQNRDALDIVNRLIEEAVWINLHIFSGTGGDPVLELRLESGYGARWSGHWKDGSRLPIKVEFRGFLEPQMEGGHELKWRH